MARSEGAPGNLPPQRGSIIVTGSDANYFPFARDMINSIPAVERASRAIGFFDLGLDDGNRAWLHANGVHVVTPRTLLAQADGRALREMCYLARPFLRENFPGFELYIWLDADTWLQGGSVLDLLEQGARASGAAVVHERERAYRFWPWLIAWRLKHFVLGYGAAAGAWLATRPHVNNGVFAMRADAPHWDRWQHRYQAAFRRTGLAAPHDQFALNAAIRLDRLPATFLPTTCNWICDLSTPMWNEAEQVFCVPYAPHAAIRLMHLAGPAKQKTFSIRSIGGGTAQGSLRPGGMAGTAQHQPA